MNRLILIGNGFDLAHDLKTSYANFIDWYWDKRMYGFINEHSFVSKDILCSFRILYANREDPETWSGIAYDHSFFNPTFETKYVGREFIAAIIKDKQNFEFNPSPFFERIIKGVESKNWGGIEEDYYHLLKEYTLKNVPENVIQGLNEQMQFIQDLLVEYLKEVEKENRGKITRIEQIITSPIEPCEIATSKPTLLLDHVNFRIKNSNLKEKKSIEKESQLNDCEPNLRCPDKIMLLSFNYTYTLLNYSEMLKNDNISRIYIHGDIHNDSNNIIFGYGDELDESFKNLKEHGNKESLRNIKSIRYLETPNYRKVLSFIESEPFQIFIMGHSCGNSDRTLLNTLFEHKNCVSIKPNYYKKEDGTDTYLELVQNISRNFNDMKLMRDRVVNKTFCEPLPQSR